MSLNPVGIDLREIAPKVAALLGTDYAVLDNGDNYVPRDYDVVIGTPNNGRLNLSTSRTRGNSGRITISAWGPHDLDSREAGYPTPISVAPTSPPERIAKEIERRLLSEFYAAIGRGERALARKEAARASAWSTAERLVDLAGPTATKLHAGAHCDLDPRFSAFDYDADISVRVYPNKDGDPDPASTPKVDVKLTSISEAEAAAVLKALRAERSSAVLLDELGRK